MRTVLIRLLPVVSISLLGFLGCSSSELIPDEGPNTLDVYQGHVGSSKQPRMFRELIDDRKNLDSYTRNARNELDGLFPKLPNPDLIMYIFPHMTGKNRPVPGYSTSFKMYEKDEYALPGEIAP